MINPKQVFSLLKPVIPNRLGRLLALKSKPEFLSIAVTWKCNSRCSTCGIWNSPHNNPEMSLTDYARLLQDPLLSNLKVWEMTGGEPFLYKNIVELTALAFNYLSEKTQIRIGTNCIATHKIFQLLKRFQNKPLFLSLSIDGIEDKHDQIRGVKGNFNGVVQVINYIRRLQRQGSPITFGASVCVSKLNLNHIPALTSWLEQNNIPFQLTPVIFPPYAKIKYARETKENLDFVSNKERAEAIQVFSRYDKLTYEIFCLYWAKMKYPLPPCYALRKYIHLTPDGDCQVCMWRPIIIGNLMENTFSQIWHSKIAQKTRKLIRDCKACAIVHPNLCDALNNYHFHGTLLTRYAQRNIIKSLRRRLKLEN